MDPVIRQLSPPTVKTGWTGVVHIYGEGFDDGSFSEFGQFDPVTKCISAHQLDATITADITNDSSELGVKVHTAGGNLSNEFPFTVTR